VGVGGAGREGAGTGAYGSTGCAFAEAAASTTAKPEIQRTIALWGTRRAPSVQSTAIGYAPDHDLVGGSGTTGGMIGGGDASGAICAGASFQRLR
jgi:hypothetical protein